VPAGLTFTGTAPRLRLYGRAGCHLCDDLRAVLEDLARDYAFVVDEIDIAGDAALEAIHGWRIPVLTTASGEELCHYFADLARIRAYLDGTDRR